MKKLLLFTTTLFLCYSLFGQKPDTKPFKLVIEKPSAAIVPDSLKNQIPIIEKKYWDEYQNTMRTTEAIIDLFNDYPESMKAEIEEQKLQLKKELILLKNKKERVQKFQYYELMSYYLSSILNLYFNEHKPYSEIYEIENYTFAGKSHKAITDSLMVDYLISFEEIEVKETNGTYEMQSKIVLYSAKADKIILQENITGDTNSYGDMWTCEEALTCLFITSIRNAIKSISKELSER